jgi:hypothetical protein
MDIFEVAIMPIMISINNGSTDDTAVEILKLLGGWSETTNTTDQ